MERLLWNKVLDHYLTNGSISSDEYYELSEIQKTIIQEIKKSFARLNK